MEFSVVRSCAGLVPPAETTPNGMLDLSVIDQVPVLRCNARTLHVFNEAGATAAKVIREGLSKALVPYYPLAGRLKDSGPGELKIACSGEGVWFVEASADCTLEAVYYFENMMSSIPFDKLLPEHPPESEGLDPLVLMQLTQFKCDGFVMGLIFCHSICDGLGAAQFLNAVGELARGLEQLSVIPVWHRDFIQPPRPQPAKNSLPKQPPPLAMPNYHLEHANIDMPFDQINQIKLHFQEATGQTCSTFEIVAASLWSCRTQAINLSQNTKVKLVFFANCRQILELPRGFYGNCFFPLTITASSEQIAGASIVEVVKLIQEAKSGLSIEFTNWTNGEPITSEGNDPFAPPLEYTTLFISEWGRLGFNQVDYGWGPPVHVLPIQGSNVIPVGILGIMPLPAKGIRLMTWCVESAHLQPLLDHMANLAF